MSAHQCALKILLDNEPVLNRAKASRTVYPAVPQMAPCMLPDEGIAWTSTCLLYTSLLAVKGHPKRQSAGIHQFVISRIEQHSKKPDEVRDKIVKLMGDLPRVELFARQKAPGWDAWGNEVDCDLVMPERSV